MPSTVELCNRIYVAVKLVQQEVENAPSTIAEAARQLYRYIKRLECLVSDLQPYAKGGVMLSTALSELESALLEVRSIMLDLYRCGPVSGFFQADHALDRFQHSAARLAEVSASLLHPDLGLPAQTKEEVVGLAALLSKAEFKLQPEHAAIVEAFRSSCDGLVGPFEGLQQACRDMLQQVNHASVLGKEGFDRTIRDLVNEIEGVVRAGQDPFYLRMLLDALRVHHGATNTPLEYLCPLSLRIMEDPVLLFETGHTYERQAIEKWYKEGHRFCPRSGIALSSWKLSLIPNCNLRDAIRRWRTQYEQQLSLRPILTTLSEISNGGDGSGGLLPGSSVHLRNPDPTQALAQAVAAVQAASAAVAASKGSVGDVDMLLPPGGTLQSTGRVNAVVQGKGRSLNAPASPMPQSSGSPGRGSSAAYSTGSSSRPGGPIMSLAAKAAAALLPGNHSAHAAAATAPSLLGKSAATISRLRAEADHQRSPDLSRAASDAAEQQEQQRQLRVQAALMTSPNSHESQAQVAAQQKQKQRITEPASHNSSVNSNLSKAEAGSSSVKVNQESSAAEASAVTSAEPVVVEQRLARNGLGPRVSMVGSNNNALLNNGPVSASEAAAKELLDNQHTLSSGLGRQNSLIGGGVMQHVKTFASSGGGVSDSVIVAASDLADEA